MGMASTFLLLLEFLGYASAKYLVWTLQGPAHRVAERPDA